MRVLLKISGDALKGKQDFGIDAKYTEKVVDLIKEIHSLGHEIAIVIGGGNIYRGGDLIKSGVNSSDSHNLSMLSTVFNGVVLKNFLEKENIETVVMDPNGIKFVKGYSKDVATRLLNNKKIVICTGGTGNPYFTTDTGGILRALELNCEVMIKATKVDGIYSSDPEKDDKAIFFDKISYNDFIEKNLKVMDKTAIVLASENSLPIKVVNLNKKGSILKAISGEKEGSIIS